jgi:hypothetical protein
MINNESSRQEKIIREYFKRKYNLELTEEDYLEVSQSLYFLGKAIYRSLQLQSKGVIK